MRWRVSLTLLLVSGALAWCFLSPSQAHEGPAELTEHVAAPVSRPSAAPPLAPIAKAPVNSPPEELPSPPAEAEENAIGMPSHPITPEHLRIYRENNLIGDLNGAMDVADVAGLRRLLQHYREEYPEDAHVLQGGYALIADCLEHPDPETRAKAQRYYDEELASGLRRYIRRHCLEREPVRAISPDR